MIDDVLEGVLGENERRVNRILSKSLLCIACLVALLSMVGFAGYIPLPKRLVAAYACAIVLPSLGLLCFLRRSGFDGAHVKYLLIGAAAFVAFVAMVPSIMGLFLAPLPLLFACQYSRPRMLLVTYLAMLAVCFAASVPYAMFGCLAVGCTEETAAGLKEYIGDGIDRWVYWVDYVKWILPSYLTYLSIIAVALYFFCKGERMKLRSQAQLLARLSDMERGLAIAVAQTITVRVAEGDSATAASEPADAGVPRGADGRTAREIAQCLAECKRRAAEDPAFARLVERDPSAAVREVLAK